MVEVEVAKDETLEDEERINRLRGWGDHPWLSAELGLCFVGLLVTLA
jgi:hypothetical protein